MNPIKFGQLMKHLVRAKQKKPDLPEVFRASDAPIPEETLTRDMFKEAQERFKNAKAGGGMLVQPGFGGTRQGYREDKISTPFKKSKTTLTRQQYAAQQAGTQRASQARFDRIGKAFIKPGVRVIFMSFVIPFFLIFI